MTSKSGATTGHASYHVPASLQLRLLTKIFAHSLPFLAQKSSFLRMSLSESVPVLSVSRQGVTTRSALTGHASSLLGLPALPQSAVEAQGIGFPSPETHFHLFQRGFPVTCRNKARRFDEQR
jgi:hypothetical protein